MSNFQQYDERPFDSQINQTTTTATMSHIGRLKSKPIMIPFDATIGIVNPPDSLCYFK
jgi:hypothetical protein